MKNNSTFNYAFLAASLFIYSALISADPAFAQTSDKKPVISIAGSTQKETAEALIQNTQVVIKVVAIKDNVVSGDGLTRPSEGNKFVSVQVVIDNTGGTDECEVSPYNFKLKDAEGNSYDQTISVVTKPTLTDGIVDSGDFVKGWVTFEIGSAVSLKSLKLRYEDRLILPTGTVKSGWIPLSAVSSVKTK